MHSSGNLSAARGKAATFCIITAKDRRQTVRHGPCSTLARSFWARSSRHPNTSGPAGTSRHPVHLKPHPEGRLDHAQVRRAPRPHSSRIGPNRAEVTALIVCSRLRQANKQLNKRSGQAEHSSCRCSCLSSNCRCERVEAATDTQGSRPRCHHSMTGAVKALARLNLGANRRQAWSQLHTNLTQ
jgi:hypothetical protein